MHESPEIKIKSQSPLYMKVVAVFVLLVLAVSVGVFAAFARIDGNKIIRGVSVAGIDLSLMDKANAAATLKQHVEQQRFSFSMNGKGLVIEPVDMVNVAKFD